MTAEERRYRSDDCDLEGEDNDLVVFSGENGDWYVSIVKHGEKLGVAVRIRTSGGPSDRPLAAVGAWQLWDGLLKREIRLVTEGRRAGKYVCSCGQSLGRMWLLHRVPCPQCGAMKLAAPSSGV